MINSEVINSSQLALLEQMYLKSVRLRSRCCVVRFVNCLLSRVAKIIQPYFSVASLADPLARSSSIIPWLGYLLPVGGYSALSIAVYSSNKIRREQICCRSLVLLAAAPLNCDFMFDNHCWKLITTCSCSEIYRESRKFFNIVTYIRARQIGV